MIRVVVIVISLTPTKTTLFASIETRVMLHKEWSWLLRWSWSQMRCYSRLESSFMEKFMCNKSVMKISVGDGISLSRQAGDKILKVAS
jgi:hypothetical protein